MPVNEDGLIYASLTWSERLLSDDDASLALCSKPLGYTVSDLLGTYEGLSALSSASRSVGKGYRESLGQVGGARVSSPFR